MHYWTHARRWSCMYIRKKLWINNRKLKDYRDMFSVCSCVRFAFFTVTMPDWNTFYNFFLKILSRFLPCSNLYYRPGKELKFSRLFAKMKTLRSRYWLLQYYSFLNIYKFSSYSCLLFQACTRKLRKPRIVHAVNDIVTEIRIPTNPSDTSFEHFADRNRDYINQIIDDQHRRHGCVALL